MSARGGISVIPMELSGWRFTLGVICLGHPHPKPFCFG